MMEKAGGIFLSFLQRNGIVVVVILAVLAVRMFLRKCPKKYSYGLWGIVGIRMIFDLPIASRFSLFNLVRLVKRKSQLTKIVYRIVGDACTAGHKAGDTGGCRITRYRSGDTYSSRSDSCAYNFTEDMCAVVFGMADRDAVIFGIWDLFLYKMPEDGTDGSSFNICQADGGKYSSESNNMGM